jgi:hypothetical protein
MNWARPVEAAIHNESIPTGNPQRTIRMSNSRFIDYTRHKIAGGTEPPVHIRDKSPAGDT